VKNPKHKPDEITTRPGSKFPPAEFLANYPRDDLFDDVATQFEKLEQPLNMEWMRTRSVSLEDVQALSQKIALVLRGYRALEPRDRIAFITQGVFTHRPLISKPAETDLGTRQSDASASDNQNHDEEKSNTQSN
jgi:hypothetical protein